MMDRIGILYYDRDELRTPGYPCPPPRSAAPPIFIPAAPLRRPSDPIVSPTSSTGSSGSIFSRNSSASSSSATTMVPPNYHLPCEFELVGCTERFHPDDVEYWISHHASHFQQADPPPYTICIFCDKPEGRFQSRGDVQANWRERMLHIFRHYSRDGPHIVGARPDFFSIEHLWVNGLITSDEYKHAMRYTEWPADLPHYPGLVHNDYQTPEMEKRHQRATQQVDNLDQERRHMKREQRQGKGERKARADIPEVQVHRF